MGFLDKLKHSHSKPDQPQKQQQQQQQQQQQLRALTVKDENDEDTLPHATASPRGLQLAKVTELGTVHSTSTYVNRDLGFQGQLSNHILLTYGDTMWSDEKYSPEFRGMTCNSVALATDNVLHVLDTNCGCNGYPEPALPPNAANGEDHSVYACGITNVIEVAPGEGIVYFLLNHRPEGKDHLLGAGVAKVTLNTANGQVVPHFKRTDKWWWDAENEPWYGDVCVLKHNGYIYAFGHSTPTFTYLARVPVNQAFQLDAYEYWNGEAWQKERLKPKEMGDKGHVFWQTQQGQMYWSKHHNCFVFVFADNFWSCSVLAKTAPAPEGPWSEAVTIHKPQPVSEGGNIYSPVPHPYYDPSHESLIITYTNHPNTIQAIKVDWA